MLEHLATTRPRLAHWIARRLRITAALHLFCPCHAHDDASDVF